MAANQPTLQSFWSSFSSSVEKNHDLQKPNLNVPALVFVSFLAFTSISGALCGALESSSKLQPVQSEDSRLIHNENIIGFSPNDPLTTCGHENNKMGERCRKRPPVLAAGSSPTTSN
jgi:hypothetical protein